MVAQERKTTNEKNNDNEDDKNMSIPTMESVDVDKLVDRCLRLLQDSQQHRHSASNCSNFNCYEQIFIGIAGTPGSGKSFIAEQVRDAINKRNPNGDAETPECVVIGMDGYHFPRKKLKEMADNGETFQTDEYGDIQQKKFSYNELMARRGAAFTYCPKQFIEDLRKAKAAGEGSFPIYDRDKHDPVPNGVSITKHNKIILVEGLYLLCLHDPDWKPLDELWDDKWYIDVSMEETKKRLIKRHLKYWTKEKTKRWGGDDEAAAARKAESNDLINAACIRKMSRGNANLIIKNETIPEDDTNNADVEAAS
jgi:pantothenate kinase